MHRCRKRHAACAELPHGVRIQLRVNLSHLAKLSRDCQEHIFGEIPSEDKEVHDMSLPFSEDLPELPMGIKTQ
jgi:hypothetical protein